MIETTLSKIKIGEYFTFKPIIEPTEKQVYIRDGYDRTEKKYTYYKFSDVCHYGQKKGTTKVYIDFTF